MTPGTQSIDRAAMLIDIVAGGHAEGTSFVEVLEHSGLTRPTARRLLQALSAHGLVQQDQGSRLYFLGPRIYELGLIVFPTYDFQDICQPELDQLVDKTGDTIFLNRVVGDKMSCIARETGVFPVKAFVLDVGIQRPIGFGASGMAVLAAMTENEAQAVLDRNASDLADFSGGLPRILELVAKGRADGYVERTSEKLGVRTVAMAICDRVGTPFASISISSIQERMTGEHLDTVITAMRENVEKIHAKLTKKRPMGKS
ncbi:IclR family transcriptional regulator [uncultured Aliiroseovarius sp.]|uniref:IclR family transcriptional regulator n=1 Tax=uncultured Aliiroseovarius sp. TaxID=1658783 RepID=UPI002599336D|nr:IclR family transcriptional regulator [uncultured Aliiroseovarius sp.]